MAFGGRRANFFYTELEIMKKAKKIAAKEAAQKGVMYTGKPEYFFVVHHMIDLLDM